MVAVTNTTSVTKDLDVLEKYESLVKNSLDGESVYIRAKETMQEMFDDGSINETDRANLVSNVIGSMVNGITSSSMSTALEWAKAEKDIALRKLEMDHQLLILQAEIDLKTTQKDQLDIQNRLAQIESKRMFGTATFDGTTGTILSLASEGKVWNDMQLVDQQIVNAGVEENLLSSKINESHVAIHKVVADTYVNFGAYTFSYDPSGNGISSVTQKHLPSHLTLSDTQKDIAVEQGKGYTYNAWANALTGSASMLGTAIASGDFDFSAGSSGDILLRTVINCANNLAVSNGNSDDAIPVNKVTVPSNIT
tara:strand:- start:482 stop:1408 length:927 start_codon:yes stop_codon:yes gene_type:complete